MQFSKLAFVSALAAVASAQTSCSIANLPSCAVTPALQAIGSTGCSATDLSCVCKNTAFINALTPAIKSGCSAADYQTAVTVAACLCAQAGVTLALPGGASSTSSTSSAAAAPSSTSTSAASVAPTTSAVATTSAVVTSTALTTLTTSSAVVVTTSVAATTVSSNATITTSGPVQVTANAAAGHGSFAVAGLLGVGALLAAL